MNKEELELLTDDEIDEKVSILRGVTDIQVKLRKMTSGRGYEYCNNISDAWPIIDENEISLFRDVSTNDVWEAIGKAWYTVHGIRSRVNADSISKNPLRAAMIVYLLMNEGKDNV